jgi:3-oxoacyl-[acyl-carrier-protein] synthase II
MTEPDPAGNGQARAIGAALRDARVAPQDVDYVNAHASSTELGDATETVAIKAALGHEKAQLTPISSIKGAIGHCLGAAGAVEAAVTVLALRDNIVPPTINYEKPDQVATLTTSPTQHAMSAEHRAQQQLRFRRPQRRPAPSQLPTNERHQSESGSGTPARGTT